MKVWISHGSEHSANLVLIGKFKTATDAKGALATLEELTKIAEADHQADRISLDGGNKKFSDAFMDFATRENFHWFGYDDPAHLVYDFNSKVVGDELIITTDEAEVGAFLKLMLSKGAKIEVFSGHDHKSPHTR